MFSIGELSRRTDLPVKTIRFYSDEGLLPPTDRTAAGYRLYDAEALARAELIRTLRELGLGLADIARVLAGASTISQSARAHVGVLDERIRVLRHRRAVLRAVANRESEWDEVRTMTRLASMSDEERRRVVDEFWDEVIAGLDVDEEFVATMRSAKPELPDDPAPEQLDAWVEFVELIRDGDFRALIRDMFEQQARSRSESDPAWDAMDGVPEDWWSRWRDRARDAVEAGVAPSSEEGRTFVDEFVGELTTQVGNVPRRRLGELIAQGADSRAERYWHLIATINGWQVPPSSRAAVMWLADALRANEPGTME